MNHEFKKKNHRWRVQSTTDRDGSFDEIVVVIGREPERGVRRSGLVLHAEMTDSRSCFVDVAGLCLWVHVDKQGIARITHVEDRRVEPVAVHHQLIEKIGP